MTKNRPMPPGQSMVATDITTRFSTERGELCAVEQVDFHVMPGEAVGLVGESGSGKSVLTRTMMGLNAGSDGVSTSGRAVLGGVDLLSLTQKQLRGIWGRRIGIVLQDPLSSLNPVRRVGTQIVETIRRHRSGTTTSEARVQAEQILREVGIADPAARLAVYPHQMSGGMRQRVMIAIALSGDPDVLIADEPTTALDVTVQRQILDLLDRERRARKMGLILVTHDLSVVASRTDRVVVMYAGQIVEEAPTRDLFATPLMPYTRALLNAVPPMDGPIHLTLAAIPGGPPDLSEPISGCRFAPRCVRVQARCTVEAPELREADDNPEHRIRCHFPLMPRDAVHTRGES
ncbi:ABC transporter ATP-binding protein [Glaciibacter psychrotolerans]|uniref:Peptide/nickel transport system ATP-binding protein n=1 Tax=Glaciibacter psychrotolerans TaxID=670054 RepID=A0A7Z0EGZ7_9MICO|nr:ABC transporter ATP-binding protein [Leifsonia psychrotolerans]NYJ21346.1 peptide/nickel transport system ATP-binding protein [Leifsonia psychrotolerans]